MWFMLLLISVVTSNGRKEHTPRAYQLKFMFAGEISSIPHDGTRNCRGASYCDTAAPGMVPQTNRMDYWDLGDINKESCPEGVLSVSRLHTKRALPSQAVCL